MSNFAEWWNDSETQKNIKECKDIATQRYAVYEGNISALLEAQLDISGVALELLHTAQEYHNDKIAELTAIERENNPSGNPKTMLDFAKRWPCPELKAVELLSMIMRSIELRTSQAQSIIKSQK